MLTIEEFNKLSSFGYPKELKNIRDIDLVEDIGREIRGVKYYIRCAICKKHIAHLVVQNTSNYTVYYCPSCSKSFILYT